MSKCKSQSCKISACVLTGWPRVMISEPSLFIVVTAKRERHCARARVCVLAKLELAAYPYSFMTCP